MRPNKQMRPIQACFDTYPYPRAAVSIEVGTADREEMIRQHEESVKRLEGYMGKEKEKQELDLKAQLAERQRKKVERLQAQKERKEKSEQLERAKVEELAMFEEEQQAERSKEEARIKMELEAEKEREMVRIEQDIAAELERKLMEERKMVEQAAVQSSNSAAERERMLNDADEKIRSMQENAKMEKVRQEQLLQDKLLKKKAKRAQGLQQKHDLALQSKAHILKSQLYNGVIRSMHQGADF